MALLLLTSIARYLTTYLEASSAKREPRQLNWVEYYSLIMRESYFARQFRNRVYIEIVVLQAGIWLSSFRELLPKYLRL